MFWKRLKQVGPGAVVAAAFIGPGTVTTCTVSGASYGYTLLWALLFSTISVIVLQSMASKLGIVKKVGLGEALREKYTGKGARILLAILVIGAVFIGNVAYETGNISGGILGLQAIMPDTSKIICGPSSCSPWRRACCSPASMRSWKRCSPPWWCSWASCSSSPPSP